jgi:copper transport protein
MSGNIGRRSLRAALMALVTGMLLLASASPAAAHATLLYTTPVAGSAVPRSPESLTLTFDSPVTLPADPLRVTGPTGSAVGLRPTVVNRSGRTVMAPLSAPIDPGLYTVTWQVIADDGDAITGSYQFGVGSAAASQLSSGAPTTSTPGAATTAALRWVLFAALAWLAGRCTIRLLTRRSEPVRPLRRVDLAGCAAGAVAAAGLRAVAIGAGDIWQGITHLPSAVVTTGSGAATSVELSAFVVAGALVVGLRYGLLWLPILLVIAAEAMRSHPHEADSWLGGAVTAIHLGAIAVWMGTLAHVLLFSRTHEGQPALPRGTWRSYARLALALVVGVLATGVLATLILTPIAELFSTTYGIALLAKVALVCAALSVAAIARVRLMFRRSPRRPAAVEAGTLVVILVASAALTVLQPPRLVAAPLLIAPAPSGPVISVGSRAGQIGLSAQASAGQIVVQMAAPGTGNEVPQPPGPPAVQAGSDEPEESTDYGLSAAVTSPGGRTAHPVFRSCGEGCFYAPVAWARGANVVTLEAAASGWKGGEAGLLVPWPPRSGQRPLKELATQLKAVPHLTLFEQVTSDTTTGLGSTHTLHLTGAEFLRSEPYSRGRAATANLIPRPGANRTLLLGYGSEGIAVQLGLDASGLPISETLATPNQLIHRSFNYPESD